MRAQDPDNPRVQDRSLRSMKAIIWAAVAVALFAALACGVFGGLARFSGPGSSPPQSTGPVAP